MTPREFAREQGAARTRWKQEQQRDMFLAWQTAAFVGSAFVGKLPEWSEVANKIAPRSKESLHLEGALLAERIGVPLRPISEEAKRALMRLRES